MKKSSRTNWKKLKKQDDASIDFSDNTETDASFWEDAEVIMPKQKVHLSIRLDEDVVAYFKKRGKGYQSKINAVLKSYITTQKKRVNER